MKTDLEKAKFRAQELKKELARGLSMHDALQEIMPRFTAFCGNKEGGIKFNTFS